MDDYDLINIIRAIAKSDYRPSIAEELIGRIIFNLFTVILPGLLALLAINIVQIIVPKSPALPASNTDANIEQIERE